ncbi:MAG TPA: alpha/beta hydrolase [Candidatus Eisenbacteria bacterium]|nr:alpha/beta hydrolase [Candidatus Eisenbacteria bacterium]
MGAEIRYAKSGEVHIAYRVFGDGPPDIVLVPGTVSHVELFWELPANEYLLKRLASFSRVIVFDKRGQGLSDRVADQTLEERVGDVLAVMDAAGSDRATIYGWSEGGQLSLKLAATHPERVSGLVLYGSYPSMYVTREQFDRFLQTLETHWGEGILVRVNAPSRRNDKAFVQWFGRLERAVASPGAILALMRANYEIDVRDLLPSINVPTLILHREGDSLVPVESGRYMAEHIPGARYVELPGVDHLLQAFEQDLLDVLLDEVEEFVTGTRRRPRAERPSPIAVSADPVDPVKHLPPAPDAEWRGADDAIAELERCREILACGEDGPGLAGLVARAEALAAAARGSWGEAEAQFVKAAETFRRYGMVWQEAQTFQSWGAALHAGADRRAAIEKVDMAIEIYRRHATGRGSCERAERDISSPTGDAGAVGAPASRAVFRREGDYWTVSWRGNVVRLKHAKGLHYIAYLLGHPGRQVLASDLAAPGTTGGSDHAWIDSGGTTAPNLGDAGTLLDAKAREQYRRRMGELREEVAEADRFNDTLRAARLRTELESLRDQIAGAAGLGGRHRKAASHAERARLMVTKAIKAALAKIRARDASLGRYLAASIKTGHCCTYDPGALPPVAWQL